MTRASETLPRLPRDGEDDYGPRAVAARLHLAEQAAQRALTRIGGAPVPPDEARGNVEGLVGFAQVPLGLAGPMRVAGAEGEYEVYVPMATTEGAMVASYSRGMAVLREAGAVHARVLSDGLTQVPMLVFEDAAAAEAAGRFAEARLEVLREVVAGTTSHGSLQGVRASVLGRRLSLRFEFGTGDAIGINMAARATELCLQHLEAEGAAFRPAARYLHGQDVEKRANARAQIEGRGRSVVAEARIPADLLERRLRVRPEDLTRILDTYRVGFAQLGTHNWLVQAANGLAGMFLATGQDVAYVTESATGQLDFAREEDGSLYLSAHLPSLLVGTVGGGTGQGTAAESLAILGCSGAGRVGRLCEILAAAVLAGDLSLMASFASHEFVAAHERLGRNRPKTPTERDAPSPGATGPH